MDLQQQRSLPPDGTPEALLDPRFLVADTPNEAELLVRTRPQSHAELTSTRMFVVYHCATLASASQLSHPMTRTSDTEATSALNPQQAQESSSVCLRSA